MSGWAWLAEAAAWWLAASLTFGAVIAAIGYTRNTIRRSPR